MSSCDLENGKKEKHTEHSITWETFSIFLLRSVMVNMKQTHLDHNAAVHRAGTKTVICDL